MNNIALMQSISGLDVNIHNPARLMIVCLLAQNKSLDFNAIIDATGLSSGNLSTHLAKLSESGYIQINKTFKGKKPHTSLCLTAIGTKAYHKWADSIVKALPTEVIIRHSSTISAIPIVLKHYLRFHELRNVESMASWNIPEHFRRGFYLPPIPSLYQ